MKKTLVNRMKNLMLKMMISCEQATFLIDKGQHTKLSLKEKFALKFHLFTCKYCRLYEVESHHINDTLVKILKFNKNEIKLSEEQKKKIIEKMELES